MLPWPQFCQKATYVDVLAQCAGQPKLLGSARSAAGPQANLRQSARVRSGRVPRRRLPRVAPEAAVATGRRTTDGPTARAARGARRARAGGCSDDDAGGQTSDSCHPSGCPLEAIQPNLTNVHSQGTANLQHPGARIPDRPHYKAELDPRRQARTYRVLFL